MQPHTHVQSVFLSPVLLLHFLTLVATMSNANVKCQASGMPKLVAGAGVGAGAGACAARVHVASPAPDTTTTGPTAELGRAHEAAVTEVKAALHLYCQLPANGDALHAGGGHFDFAGAGHEPDARICLAHREVHGPSRPRFIVEFDHTHRTPAKLQQLARQYFADKYVAAVLVIKVYSSSRRLACLAVLYTRDGMGGVPTGAWDLGPDGLNTLSKLAFGRGAPTVAGQHALGGVPADMWVRHTCAPVPTFDGSSRMTMQYDDPPGPPVCQIDVGHLFYIPHDGHGHVPDVMPTEPLSIDLGTVLGKFMTRRRQ